MGEAANLCRSCGLCCNGILFDYVPVNDGEAAALERLGFAIRRTDDGAARFDHPCPKFCGSCSIYSARPDSCRAYRCELLVKLEAGTVSYRHARGVVQEAMDLICDAEKLSGPNVPHVLPMQSRRLFEHWQASGAGRRKDAESALVLKQLRLQRFLDLHFRTSEQRRVVSKN